MKEVLNNVEKKEFSEFANKVRTSLADKLRNNPVIKDKASELTNLQNMKNIFAKISPNTSAEDTE